MTLLTIQPALLLVNLIQTGLLPLLTWIIQYITVQYISLHCIFLFTLSICVYILHISLICIHFTYLLYLLIYFWHIFDNISILYTIAFIFYLFSCLKHLNLNILYQFCFIIILTKTSVISVIHCTCLISQWLHDLPLLVLLVLQTFLLC